MTSQWRRSSNRSNDEPDERNDAAARPTRMRWGSLLAAAARNGTPVYRGRNGHDILQRIRTLDDLEDPAR